MLRLEAEFRSQGFEHIAGVDEAGRGPLAGPVTAAAVVLSAAVSQEEWLSRLQGLTDSKKLSAPRREAFFMQLTQSPEIRFAVVSLSALQVDKWNILRATHRAMAKALAKLDVLPDFALVDGLPVKGLPCPHQAVVKGDAKSLSIAAASVIAKVTRDRLMQRLARKYPGYGFERHMGYGTAEHLQALHRLGPCPAHRLSFRPVGQLELPFKDAGETPSKQSPDCS